MRYLINVFLCLLSSVSFAQKYPVSEIPSELRKGSDVIVRLSDQRYEITGLNTAVYSENKVITINNADAFGFAVFNESYDKLSKLKSIKINYFDKEGKLIKRVKSGEIKDYNITSSGSLYDDNRIKYYEPEEFDYPFTVEYSYTTEFNGIFGVPGFVPRFTNKQSVEKASFSVIAPTGYNIRYKVFGGLEDPVKNSSDKDSYTWNVEGLPSTKSEFMGEPVWRISPRAMLGLSEFSMEGYQGDLSTWNGYGEWQAKLNAGRDQISDEVKAEVDKLIDGITDSREKARVIYDYMQRNTRYVSIQLGIGGLQPFNALDVIENGYGDCKALTNYTYSLLKYAGVNSNYVKIKAGEGEYDMEVDFPSPQSNHVILAVPMEKDTVWLECTSQTSPFNFLGSFTDDRHGLLITEEGKGVLVKTPKYSAEESSQNRVVDLEIDADGNAVAKIKTVYKGLQYDWIYGIVKEGTEDQRKYLLNSIDLPAFDLGKFDYVEDRSTEIPHLTEKIVLNVRKYASKSGKRLFLTPNILNRMNSTPPKDEDRESPIIVDLAYTDIDSVNIKLPEGYRLEFQLKDFELNTDYGDYKLIYTFDQESNTLNYTRSIKINDGQYPASDYQAYRKFIRDVVKADKSKIVLIGET